MTTTVTARDELLHALFTTALEGGINYWAEVETYRWAVNDDAQTSTRDLVEDWHGFYAIVWDDDALIKARIDRTVMSRGYDRAISAEWRKRLAWSTEPPPHVVTDALEDWDFDAGDADMIVQLGLFGEVVYG